MEQAKQFPILLSAANSRSASPAPSNGSPGRPSSSITLGQGSDRGAASPSRAYKQGWKPKSRNNKKQKEASGRKTGNTRKETNNENTPVKGVMAVAVSGKEPESFSQDNMAQSSVSINGSSKPAHQNNPRTPGNAQAEPKNRGKNAPRRRTTVGTSASATEATANDLGKCSSVGSVQPDTPKNTMPVAAAPLGMAVIVQGENGRARVMFNSQMPENDHRMSGASAPRFAPHSERRSSTGQFGSRARFPVPCGDDMGLGLTLNSPMSPAQSGVSAVYNVGGRTAITPSQSPQHAAPPEFRQRSFTSTQLRSSARSFSPQNQKNYQHQHQQYQQQNQQPPRRLSSISPSAYKQMVPQSAPVDGAVNSRVRSQTVSTHTSMTGLRISMSQSRPGNVMAPHLPQLSRASSGGSTQTNTYANGGYFATRRASVSNVGLAVDPDHSIRIPTIMFQKPKTVDYSKGAARDVSGNGTVTPVTGDGLRGAETEEFGESLAMQKLQEMISSMRSFYKPKQEKAVVTQQTAIAKTEAEVHFGTEAEAEAEVEAVKADVMQTPLTPAAHPTSRFDSILEEDEDDESDEAKLDADGDSLLTANGTGVSHSAARPLDEMVTAIASVVV
ncbi:hypothetical protein BX661DRAFT_224474 [Kickxella alabastrina]|uniref:uncharacterized protein n=1 Tax=Kickxella alabastrina TaxID=61397 RepID=UPI0022203E59|nr:uncharacterized protein BX661DRAFT_224474 [Kickxella alabastrina]KAI7828509.1 hypothetical protein BX661DRAFT_224474 [Kickxella alabastrina]